MPRELTETEFQEIKNSAASSRLRLQPWKQPPETRNSPEQ